ncbi:MAG: 16S rRNA (adenine(1408)-N(1))-methyltransferase NpmA [Ruminococcus sp.]|nr:16S rRNA (adenine(1408)-N(1))-methyltransferase NpmA [Ruminococcus sp.]
MRVLTEKGLTEMDRAELEELAAGFSSVCVDIGTGDGKRIYRIAAKSPERLYIGIDPVRENMQETARKKSRKPAKGGIANLLLVVGAVEELPEELYGVAGEVTVFFPWGSLLECIVKPVGESMEQIRRIARNDADFTFVTTYSTSYESAEIDRRQLPDISIEYLRTEYSQRLSGLGFEVSSVRQLTQSEVMDIGSQWAKRLAGGRKRDYFIITGKISSGI